MPRTKTALLPMALSVGLAACDGPTAPSPQSETETEDLITRLERAGGSVVAKGSLAQPFFSVDARLFDVNAVGTRMQVFEYPTPGHADAEAALVDHDGRFIAGRAGGPDYLVCWVGTPRFYRDGRLIVLYLGDDTGVVGLVDRVLRAPFAGGVPNPPQDPCR